MNISFMENQTLRLASDYFKSRQYPKWLDRTLRIHVCNPVQEVSITHLGGDSSQSYSNSNAELPGKAFCEHHMNAIGFPGRIAEDNIVETLTIPVYSVTLTKESEYFERLFGGGFREAYGHLVDVYITTKEKEAFKQIIQLCTDASDISLTDVEELLTLWNLSDRLMFKRSCVYAVTTLTNASLTWQQSIRIIEISSHCCINDCPTEELVEKCSRILVDHFQNLHFLCSSNEEDQVLLDELKALPSSALEVLLSSDHLPVQREEAALYGMVIWAQHNATTREEEQQLMTKMAAHIRFPFMKPEVLSTLTEVCEMGHPFCQQLLVEALKYRAASDEMKEKYRSEAVGHSRFRRRKDYYKPIKVITLEHPRKQATVHMTVLFDDIEAMNTGGVLEYESFNLSGNRFCLRITKTSSQFLGKKRIGLEMLLKNNSFPRIRSDIRVSIWSQIHMKFVNKFREFHTFEAENSLFSYSDLLGKEWEEFSQAMDVERKIYICVEFFVNNL